MKPTARKLSVKNIVLTTMAMAGLVASTAACGGDSSDTSAEEQALIELLLAAAQDGNTSAIADIVAEADPNLVAQVLPEVEDELGSPLPPIVPTGEDDNAIGTADDSTPNPPVDPQTSPTEPSSPPSSSSVATLPGGASTPTPTVPSVSFPTPTSSAPSVSIPNISLPGIPTLPTPNLPTPATIADVKLLTVGNQWKLEVLVSGGIWDSATKTRSPESVFVRFRGAAGIIQSKYMSLDGRLGTNTTIWAEFLTKDADPCSFEIAVAPSTTFQRFRLGESC